MDRQERFTKIRTKMVGALMYDARLASHRTVEECAQVMGVTPEQYRQFENGQEAPALPAVETLAYYLDIPLNHFWGRQSLSQKPAPPSGDDQRRLHQLRNRLIGVQLKQARGKANLSTQELAKKAGVSEEQLKRFELGQEDIPLPQLDALLAALNLPVEQLFDRHGPVGQWRLQQEWIQEFNQLPEELKDFVIKPVNRPYLELAKRLSNLSVEKLRAIAEGLLEITY